METITIDLRDTVAKPAVRVPEAVRVQMAAAVAAERARLTAELVKPAPVPGPAPRRQRQRQRSLTTILRQARNAGADRVEYGGAVIHLTGSGSPAAPAESANPWDQLLPPGGRHGAH